MGNSSKINSFSPNREYLIENVNISLNNWLLQIVLTVVIAIVCGYFLIQDSILRYLPLFILGTILFIIKPYLGLYAIYLSDIWFSYHENPISQRTIILFIVASIYMMYFFYKKKIKIDKKVNSIIYIIFILLIWGLITDFLINKVPLKNIYEVFARVWVPVLIALLSYFLIETKKHLEKFLYIVIFGVSISSLTGIFQFFLGNIFYNIVPHPEHLSLDISKKVIFGLSGIPHIYASQLASTVPLILALMLSKSKFKKMLLISFAISIIALLLSFVRSAIYGCAISIIILSLITKKRKKIIIALIIVIFLLLLPALSKISPLSERLFQMEGSALGRIPLALSALYISKDNPFGIGRGRYIEEAEEYLWKLERFEYYKVVTGTTPHNQFLNILVYWGLPGFLLLISFYYKILRQVNIIRKTTNNEYLKALSTGLLCSYIAYIVNSMFHNNGAFTGDPFHWYIIGVTFVLMKLERKKNLQKNAGD